MKRKTEIDNILPANIICICFWFFEFMDVCTLLNYLKIKKLWSFKKNEKQ